MEMEDPLEEEDTLIPPDGGPPDGGPPDGGGSPGPPGGQGPPALKDPLDQ